jgi:beta-lactamase class A
MLVQSGSSAMTGSAMYHDVHDAGTVRNLNGGRWAVAKDVKADDVVTTPKAFVTTVVTATDANDPDSTDVHYGVGEMYVNSDGEIWIYTGS